MATFCGLKGIWNQLAASGFYRIGPITTNYSSIQVYRIVYWFNGCISCNYSKTGHNIVSWFGIRRRQNQIPDSRIRKCYSEQLELKSRYLWGIALGCHCDDCGPGTIIAHRYGRFEIIAFSLWYWKGFSAPAKISRSGLGHHGTGGRYRDSIIGIPNIGHVKLKIDGFSRLASKLYLGSNRCWDSMDGINCYIQGYGNRGT